MFALYDMEEVGFKRISVSEKSVSSDFSEFSDRVMCLVLIIKQVVDHHAWSSQEEIIKCKLSAL